MNIEILIKRVFRLTYCTLTFKYPTIQLENNLECLSSQQSSSSLKKLKLELLAVVVSANGGLLPLQNGWLAGGAA